MVKINKIYTRTGDDGTTGLVGGSRVSKDSLKVQAYGDVDELNSWIGLVRTVLLTPPRRETPTDDDGHSTSNVEDASTLEQLATIQNILFDIGAVLASSAHITWPTKRTDLTDDVTHIEHWIDLLSAKVPELRSFVLPGGSLANSYLHIARTVCRRAERSVVALVHEETMPEGILHYLNRLSDYLFALARFQLAKVGGEEFLWNPGENKPRNDQIPS